MMKFQCTEYCTAIERLKIVSDEIKKMYPGISSDKIKKIASFCSIVSDKVDSDDIFIRYYYILLIIQDDNFNFDIVYNDMKKYCEGRLKSQLTNYLYSDIEKYVDGSLDSFPMISDYYGNE